MTSSKTELTFDTTEELLKKVQEMYTEEKAKTTIKRGDEVHGNFYIEDANRTYSKIVIEDVYKNGYRGYTEPDEWEAYIDLNLKQQE